MYYYSHRQQTVSLPRGNVMENKKFKRKNTQSNESRKYKHGRETEARDDAIGTESEVASNLVIGRNAVRELLSGDADVEKVYVQRGEREGSINLLVSMVKEKKIPLIELDRSKLDRMCANARHQGIIAVASEHEYSTVDEILEYAESLGEPPFIVLLDGVEDPHNLGAILRSAECMGAHGVIIPKRRAVGLTPTVAKASAGAIMHIRVAKVTNLASTIDELKERGIWFYAADMGDSSIYERDMRGAVGIVMGSEGDGISRLVKEKCDFVVSIPMYGKINSMNVSCAAAVILSEVARQNKGEVNQ